MRFPLRRLLSFGALQLVAAIAPLAVLPVLVREIGVEGWVGLSVGYGIGAAGAVAVAMGWPVTGPPLVAGATPGIARSFYRESLLARVLALVCVAAVALPVAALLAPDGQSTLACTMAFAVATWGLTPSWFYVGRGAPSGILRYETLPRLAAALVAIPAVGVVGAWSYPALLVGGTLVGLAGAARDIRHLAPVKCPMQAGSLHRARSNTLIAASGVVGAGYTSLAVPIATAATSEVRAVSDLAGSIRIRFLAQAGVAAVTSAYQGWVAEPPDAETRHRRTMTAVRHTLLAGLATSVVLFAAGPFIAQTLFGGVAVVSWTLSALTALAVLPYAACSTLSFHVLAPAGRGHTIATSRIVGTIVGVPSLFLMTREWGAPGAATAMLVSEVIVLAWQLPVAVPMLRRPVAVDPAPSSRPA